MENFKNTFYIALVSATFNLHDTVGIGLLTRLRLDFSQLIELKLRQHIRDSACVSPIVTVVLKYIPFLLRCPLFPCRKKSPILNLEKNILTNVLLFGSDKYDKVITVDISKSPIVYLKSTKRFEKPLIHH